MGCRPPDSAMVYLLPEPPPPHTHIMRPRVLVYLRVLWRGYGSCADTPLPPPPVQHHPEASWYYLADDDTILSVPRFVRAFAAGCTLACLGKMTVSFICCPWRRRVNVRLMHCWACVPQAAGSACALLGRRRGGAVRCIASRMYFTGPCLSGSSCPQVLCLRL
jgi:hypothetical protein